MAPKDTVNGQSENQIPASVIAQAEAAILGNVENAEEVSATGRRPSVAEQSSKGQSTGRHRSRTGASRHHHSPRPEVARSYTSRSHLRVPNILHDTGGEAPPAYGDKHDQIDLSQDGLDTKARVTDDGRVNIDINQKTRKLSNLLVPALRNQLSLVAQEEEKPLPTGYIPPALGGSPGQSPPPKLNVVIHVVGSRGDVQPFVALGKTLKATYGHRVRLATHPTFQKFVEENGLEFFSIGGDPSELMAFMVKNPGLMPGFDSLKSGDVGKRRKGMEEIVLGCWRSCIEAGDGLGAPVKTESSTSLNFDAGINLDAAPLDRPFIADAIIANPPSFAHVHIAEKMGIPLHMMFTMPWSPTQQFPHPLANIQSSNADVNMTNFVSYALVEMMTWQGLGDVINRFRERALGLDPISLIWAPGMLSRLRVPYTYCWSPALIPKPKDWGQHISVSGFYFLSLASSYTPDPELAAFLAAGPPPVYIGFGSIVVEDPNAMTKMIFEAIKIAGVRALVSKGWGGLGGDALGVPEGVFMLGNVPHDWLFQHVSAVCHHGGAGTTAAGIATGKPTVVVPFFGDQPFWGAMVARAGAGPPPIPYKQLTAENLAAALTEALKPETQAKAKDYGLKIKEEKGTEVGGKSFHDQLDIDTMRCTLSPSRIAVWRVKRTQTRLSAFAANVLANEGLLDFADLKLYRPREYETEDGPWDPITGGASALMGTIGSLMMGVADFPLEIFKSVRKQQQEKAASKQTSDQTSLTTTTSNNDLTDDKESLVESEATASTVGTSSKNSMESSNLASEATLTPITSSTSIEKVHRAGSNSLREALRGTLSRSRSVSRDRSTGSRSTSKDRSPAGHSRQKSTTFDPSALTIDNAIGAGKGVQRIVGAGLKSPMDFTLGIARGFHNAPKLYGDDTVRPQEKVTDFQSGLKAAGKEFGYGFYDGITGLVTQPIRGAEKEGAAGLIKGIGKGIGGLILKPGAAIWGLPGYTFMGIHKEVRKMFGSSVLNYIISARTAQGFEDAKNATEEERREVLKLWNLHKDEYQSEKQKIVEQGGPEGQESGRLTPKGFLQTRHMSFDERKKLHADRKARREAEARKVHGTHEHPFCPFCRRTTAHTHAPSTGHPASSHTDDAHDGHVDFESAIHASVAATSRGNAEEDAMIERAIRASVRELEAAQNSAVNDQEALSRAIQASIAEAGSSRQRNQQGEGSGTGVKMTDTEAEHQAALEKAIQESLLHYQLKSGGKSVDGEHIYSDDDEDIKKAIELSRELNASKGKGVTSAEEDEEFKLALQKSKESAHKEKSEEETVIEYVKKQSLLEKEHKTAVESGKGTQESTDEDRGRKTVQAHELEDTQRTPHAEKKEAALDKGKHEREGINAKELEEDTDADAEALRLAIEESMRGAGGSASRT